MRRTAPLALAALAAALPAAAQTLEPFRFGTNWVAQAEHGGFYQSMVDGTYAACGLDVSITPGGPQVNGRAMMLAGRLDGYMGGNMLLPFNALGEGIPVVVVAASFQKEPQVIMTHPGVASKFEDLKSLTLMIGDAGYQSYYQWMKAAFGFTDDQRRPYTFNSAPFLADVNSGQQGYITSEPYAIETEAGIKTDLWLLADYGFDTYSTTIEVTRDTLETRPDAVKCFVDGTALGWVNFLYGDNEAAIAKIMADNPDMTRDKVDFAIRTMIDYGIVDSGDAETMGVGAMTDARMQSFYAKMVEAGVLEDGLDIAQAYTLDFVNKGVGLAEKKALLGQ
ncbi:MAG: ABC transporter substrate-binding protein [Rubrimonas sp.]|uniref:ABC transporter substrate-binding protein n=1 Tax=Rubrimonas sp. TaxID=2036015 RepID=UPI002FDC9909